MIQFITYEACDARMHNASFTIPELLFQVTEGEIGFSQRWEHGAVHREPCIVTKMDCEGRTIDGLRGPQHGFEQKIGRQDVAQPDTRSVEKRVRVATRPLAKAFGGGRII